MLNTYLTQTGQLLQNPAAATPLYSVPDLTSYINRARGQLAGEAQCIRRIGTLSLASPTNVYSFDSITISDAGVQGIIHVRTIWLQQLSGQIWLRPRPFEWFGLYELNNPLYLQNLNQPKIWAQYGQGSTPQSGTTETGGGSLYFSPVPDIGYTVSCDCVCYPIPLVDDTTSETIPYLWTDAVPYFAAYLALLSAQNGARSADANNMFERYQEFMNRGRKFATPGVLPGIYPQNPSQVTQNQLGIAKGGQ